MSQNSGNPLADFVDLFFETYVIGPSEVREALGFSIGCVVLPQSVQNRSVGLRDQPNTGSYSSRFEDFKKLYFYVLAISGFEATN